jgi:hypothetical protein
VGGPTNLLYHIYPLAVAHEMVDWNIEQIVSRRAAFTGQAVVTVATGPETLPFPEVRDRFPKDWLVLEVPNNRKLREVAGWNAGWPHLERLGGQVLFCHAKGVTRWNRDYSQEAKTWTWMMYRTLIDFPQQVASVLRNYPLAGSFKKTIRGFYPESKSEWHYHGAFYWVREDLIPHWKDILQVWFGVESFPGDILPPESGGEVFRPTKWANNQLNLYNRTICQDTVKEEEEWERTTLDWKSQLTGKSKASSIAT